MLRMGIDPDDPGFEHVVGLRVYSRDARIELRWPELDGFPDYGLVRTRHDFDELLVRRAEAGARVYERTEAVAPVATDGWITGARVRDAEDRAAPLRDVRAKFVLAADGAASRFASQAGVRRDATRPLGIAARRYFRVERRPDRGSSRGWTCGRAICSPAGLRLAVPRLGRDAQPRRRDAEHVQGLQGHLRAAALRCLRGHAASRLEDRRETPNGEHVRLQSRWGSTARRWRSQACSCSATRRDREPVQRKGSPTRWNRPVAAVVHDALIAELRESR